MSSNQTLRPFLNFLKEAVPSWNLYPLYSPTRFCEIIKHSKGGLERCIRSDREAAEIVIKEKKALVYQCHAGIMDGIVPIMLGNEPVAFLVFGQFLTEPPTEESFSRVWERVKDLELPYEELKDAFFHLAVVPQQFVERMAEGMFSALQEFLRSLSRVLPPLDKQRLYDLDAEIWLAQLERQILLLSKEEGELLSRFQWASIEVVLNYWVEWMEKEIKHFEESPWETKSRIWGVITSLLSYARLFQASSRINLLEFYSHYAAMVKRCNTKEEMREALMQIINDLLAIRGQTSYRASIVERVKRFILQNYDKEGLCLREVARAFRLSPYYLAHLFKNIEGISIGEYIKNIRMAQARKRLSSKINCFESLFRLFIVIPPYLYLICFVKSFLQHLNPF
ncbi:PocR ligand-binding domain-containing protein [bacterium]|nr:PocR ligand-binding domain-containing protein [bacterium]